MFKNNKVIQLALVLGIVLLAINLPIMAQSYAVKGRPVAAAQASSGGDFTLSGSAGQPEAGSALSGGGFSLSGGSSFGGSSSGSSGGGSTYSIYLPLVLRN